MAQCATLVLACLLSTALSSSTCEVSGKCAANDETGLVQKTLSVSQVGDPESKKDFAVELEVQLSEGKTGTIQMKVHRDWAPLGAEQFHKIVESGNVLKEARFFRVVENFMVQFGIAGDPEVAAKWDAATIPDDEVKKSNKRGYVTFATAGPNTRTTQLFINTVDNPYLDDQGFSPFAEITKGMDVVDAIYTGYGEQPDQNAISMKGNTYLKQEFPKLSYIKSASIVKLEENPAKKKPHKLTQLELARFQRDYGAASSGF